MADIAVQSFTDAGLEPTFTAAAAAGDKFLNSGNEFIVLKSSNASPITVTFETTKTYSSLSVADRTVVVAGAVGGVQGQSLVGKLLKDVYNVATGADAGKVAMTYTTNTGLTIAVLKLA